MLHEAHDRSPHTALTPIPEASKCSGKPDLERAPEPTERTGSVLHRVTLSDAMAPRPIVSMADERAERIPSERTDSGLSDATTPRAVESAADERAGRAAKRAAAKRELPAWHSVKEWPAHREAFGRLTLRASDDPQAEGVRAVCRVRDGALTLVLEQRAASGERTEKVVAEVPLEALAVGMRRGRANMLTVATVHESNLFDEIYCVCDDPARRNRWIAVFRGMGVAIFDLRD